MITGSEIAACVDNGSIGIEPFDHSQVKFNSYDVRLARRLYRVKSRTLDLKKPFKFEEILLKTKGFILRPGELYLGVTKEWTSTPHHIPTINGRSTIGRYGIVVHQTAGTGDIGYKGHWTLEISAVRRVRIYPDIRIAQMMFTCPHGVPLRNSYAEEGHYNYVEYCDDPSPKLPIPGNL